MLITGALIAVSLAACSLPTPFAPAGTAEACPAALLEGRLASDGRGGARLVWEFGPQAVQWPDGYRVEGGDEGVLLLDPNGAIVAIEGDMVYVGGGFTAGDELFLACGYVSRDPP